jgi:hypothetical protein
MDSQGNLYVADSYNNVIRKIDTSSPRIITTVVGTGTPGYTGDGGPATSATLNSPDRVSVNGAGNFFISDSNNQVVRRVDGVTNNIATFAGNGKFAFAGDGGPALSASFATPVGVVVGPQGNLYVGDLYNNRIRKVLLNPSVNLSVTTLPFANQPINGTSMLPVMVTNSGDAPLTISNVSVSAGAFSLASNPCPGTLAVGAQCALQIGFAPTQFIQYTGIVTLTDNGPTPGSTQVVNLSGTGAASLTVTATGTGTITSSPAGINCPTTCTATFAGNSQVTLTASAGANSSFSGFSAGCVPVTALTCTVTLSANETVTATFTTGTNSTLTVTKAGTGTGTVTSAPAGINCGTTCSAPFANGTQVVLTATPATGSTFTGWGAPCSGTGTCTLTITAATTVAANFTLSASNFTLTVAEAGTGSGTVTSNPAGIACQPTCSAPFASGTQVVLTATPATGSTFAGWGAPCSGTGTCTLTITAATTVAANFTLTTNNFTLTIAKGGTGTGTVTSAPAGINCGVSCSAPFASGTQVILTATPATGSTFAGWGAPCSGTGTCTLTITAATTVAANFTLTTNNFTLTVVEAGTGSGTVTSNPAGIACQPTCSASFASGQVVVLTATAAEGSTFAGWSGAGCSGTGTCSVTITVAATVTATFNSGNSPVTISVAPGSPSTVSTTPGGNAVFGLLLTAAPGTTGTVTLGCTSPSTDITCQIVPGTITLTGKGTNVAIVLNTYCVGALPVSGPFPVGGIGRIGLLLATLALCGAMWKIKPQPRWALSFAVLIMCAMGMSACASLAKSPGGQATPPGNYTLTVSATAPNGAVSSVNLALTVLQ